MVNCVRRFRHPSCCVCVCACADAPGDEPSVCVGELRLEHVSFRYPARPDVMVMKDFCLEVKAGRCLCGAVCNKKGCHKP